MLEVVVIGAGMAGIAAARLLQDRGRAVAVVEARNRIGGRIHTDYTLGFANDLGASWVHGPIANPVMRLVREYGLSTGFTDFRNTLGRSVLAIDADGSPIDLPDYTLGLQRYAGAYQSLFASQLYDSPGENVRSLSDLYATGLPETDDLSAAARLGLYYAAVVRAQYGDAADLDEIDWRRGESYVKLPGGDLLLPRHGYAQVVERLAERLSVQFDTQVLSLSRSGTNVVVTTDQGEIHARRVIVAVPLGVLKSGRLAFDPPLPADKQAAIERLGYGNYEKLALRFPDVDWPTHPHRFNFFPFLTPASAGSLPEMIERSMRLTEPELFTSWLNVAHYTNEPVLVAHHAGSRAVVVNQWGDEELVGKATRALRRFLNPSLPDAVGYVRTCWQDDPFALGSYSFPRVGSNAGDRRALARPLDNQLYFAGEATHSHYFATVHGAYESGISAARKVLASL